MSTNEDELEEVLGHDPPDDTILQGESSNHQRWWVTAGLNTDSYDIFVVNYYIRDGRIVSQHYLNKENHWIKYEQSQTVEPALHLPGNLVHLIATDMIPETDRMAFSESLSNMLVELFRRIIRARTKIDETEPGRDPKPNPQSRDWDNWDIGDGDTD